MPAAKKVTDKDRLRVQLLAAGGATQETIAKRMEMTDKTLREHFREELDFGLLEINTLAIGELVRAIKSGQSWAICFWLKTRAGWRETERYDHRFVDEHGKDRPVLGLDAVQAYMNSVPDAPPE